jgi:hypothetical protein
MSLAARGGRACVFGCVGLARKQAEADTVGTIILTGHLRAFLFQRSCMYRACVLNEIPAHISLAQAQERSEVGIPRGVQSYVRLAVLLLADKRFILNEEQASVASGAVAGRIVRRSRCCDPG